MATSNAGLPCSFQLLTAMDWKWKTGNAKNFKRNKNKKNAITRSESALSLPENDLDELKAKLEAMHHESDHMS